MGEEVLMAVDCSLDSYDDESHHINGVMKENENLNIDFLEDWESYWDDINDRLTVSRIVSDSVIKGMVSAIESEAAEKIAQKELEVAELRKTLFMYHVAAEEDEASLSHIIHDTSCLVNSIESGKIQESLEHSRTTVKSQEDYDCAQSFFVEYTKEIKGLRVELDIISKSLLGYENGNIEADPLQRKISGCNILSTSLWDSNDKERDISVSENYDVLQHLSHDELISHFKTEMNQMKIEHDYKVHKMMEDYYGLKRAYLNLKERGSFSLVKRDENFDFLRKKIPDFVSRLDKILSETEKFVLMETNKYDHKSHSDLLLLENSQLRDSLTEIERENRTLSSQISDALMKSIQLSQAESDLLDRIRKLESDVDDSHIDFDIYEEVFRCILRDIMDQIKRVKEESEFKNLVIMRDIALEEDDLEDSCMQSVIVEECCGVIYKEHIRALEMNVSEKEDALREEKVEKNRLRQEIHSLQGLVKLKEELVHEAENSMAEERQRFKVVLSDLQDRIQKQDIEITENTARAMEKTTELRQINDEKMKLMAIKDDHEQIIETLIGDSGEFIKGFIKLELEIEEKTRKLNSRLNNLQSQMSDVSQKADEHNKRTSLYKQRLNKACFDLQKAEAEVDILGDEVESLMDLMKKIYIALDHYSPILKHYPGITEVLKLVRRQINGGSKRSS